MNLIELHKGHEVSAKSISGTVNAGVTAIQVLKGGMLKEHITKTSALLICVLGEVDYEDEKGNKINLRPGDFYEIEPMVKHWLSGIQDSQLVLIR